jgi:predicted RNA-binding Zn ribbon-like protein
MAPTQVKTTAAATAIVELLNSRAYEPLHLPDALDSQQSAAAVLRPFGLGHPDKPTAQQLSRVRALRSALMVVIEGEEPSRTAQAWADIEAETADVRFRYTFDGTGQSDLIQESGDPIAGGIVRAITGLQAAGQWSRLRICASDQCSKAFYDATRSRTQRWDNYETCGNRNNVAAFRARARQINPTG